MATQELQSARHRPENVSAIILLSDGANSAGRDPLNAANEAKAVGIQIFTIGLGSDVDANQLLQIASSPSHYFFAPTPADLTSIYQTLAEVVGCVP